VYYTESKNVDCSRAAAANQEMDTDNKMLF